MFQYPLKEVVAIASEPATLEDVKSLERYILEVKFVCPYSAHLHLKQYFSIGMSKPFRSHYLV